jgi:hypothetical protein
MATTLLLDRDDWDICLDASGNIALASLDYAKEQDVASECRVYAGECYFDTTIGVDYNGSILGHFQPVQVIKEQFATAANRVPGVSDVVIYLTDIDGREIGGQIQFKGGTTNL